MKALSRTVWLAATILLSKRADAQAFAMDRANGSTPRFIRKAASLDARNEERSPFGLKNVVGESAPRAIQKVRWKAQAKVVENIQSRHASAEEALRSRLMPLAMKLGGDQTQLIQALTKKYGFDNVILRLLDPRLSPELKSVGDALLHAQIMKFYDDGYSADQLFTELKIDTSANVLSDRYISLLERFIRYSNDKKPNEMPDDLFRVLSSRIEEGVLADSVANARVRPLDAKRAEYVEDHLVERWLVENNLHPLALLERLGMDQSVDKFVSLRLETVSKYVTKYNEYHPNDEFLLLGWATHKYRFGPLMKALQEAQVVKEKREFTTLLLNEQLQTLLAHDTSVADVFELLELKTDLSAYKNLNIKTLQTYMEMFNAKHGGNQDILPFLVENLDDGPLVILLAMHLREKTPDEEYYLDRLEEVFQRWREENIKPGNIKTTFFKNPTEDLQHVVDPLVWHYGKFFTEWESHQNERVAKSAQASSEH
ncbi:hypothetical protein PsorP6_011855 [Peronosclerospora sorghi]|uniref:Uncharacterized protein n=1 Tax=Peronosclerospora sorghi TaxID=230839 RepID=A0ACC0WK74_9STRA|nr:hypothetical protein PsorP6_011855 [Peronosclerospora sorghi]